MATIRGQHRILRLCAILGVGLIAISFVMANSRTFAPGDMRVFTWVLVASIILVIGCVLVLGAAIGALVVFLRHHALRRQS